MTVDRRIIDLYNEYVHYGVAAARVPDAPRVHRRQLGGRDGHPSVHRA